MESSGVGEFRTASSTFGDLRGRPLLGAPGGLSMLVQSRRLRSADAGERSRSDRQPPPPRVGDSELIPLLKLQCELLAEQTSYLKQSAAASEVQYTDPNKMLDTFEPTFKPLASRWLAEFKKLVSSYYTQLDLKDKYDLIANRREVMKQFHEESLRKWQWCRSYTAVARPLDDAMSDAAYDIDKDWADLRLRHALECQDFIVKHQVRCLQYFDSQLKEAVIYGSMNEVVAEWTTAYGKLVEPAVSEALAVKAKRFVHLCMRTELPRAQSRLDATRKRNQKTRDALLQNEVAFQQLDSQALAALIELDKHSRKVKDGQKIIRHLELDKFDFLAALYRKHPDLQKHFVVKFTNDRVDTELNARGSSSNSAMHSKPKPRGRPKAKTTRSPARNTSVGSKASHSSRASRPRSSTRPRSLSRSSKGSHVSSASAKSKSSHASKNAVARRSATPAPGKGRGRGRGRGRGGGRRNGSSNGAKKSSTRTPSKTRSS